MEEKYKLTNTCRIRCRGRLFAEIGAIIFDKDGTLADSEDFLRQLAINRARLIDAKIPGIYPSLLKAFGVGENYFNPSGLMAVGSNRENQIVAAGYIAAETGKSWFEALTIAASCFEEAEKALPKRGYISPLFAGSLEVIQRLSAKGLKLAILSADTTQNIRDFVETHQLTPYIDFIMGVDGHISKPDPRLYLAVCDKIGVKPENTLMVGDSQGDIAMARKANAGGVIGICWKLSYPCHLQQADVVIHDLAEIQVDN
ncbi:MAG: HAD family hydrolase [Geminocystis sp.]|nr:HAD family hydrolase [Geminocystis sp.]HIK36902.1 HAD family hydrolase [Geminocystis sp. M7585_C2015_104]MCS7148546.1 HAD family hydrolase [Geminocystis sp.]MCX8079502.1 HAD family hydrolase [Geminocystis sp.]MDW8114881.1 HAD family hydrolase [Geminocystis sp.]